MSPTVTESNAVFTLLSWLVDQRDATGLVPTDEQALAAAEVLAASAGKRMQVWPHRHLARFWPKKAPK